MQSHYTISEDYSKKYEYPKSPFSTMQETVEATELLKHDTMPALWTGNRIIPYAYDAFMGMVADEAICDYCYELSEDWRIMGDALILLEIRPDATEKILVARHLYPYFDKGLGHKDVYRVVHNQKFPIPFERKSMAPEGYVFHRYRPVATPRTWLEEYLGEKYTDEHRFHLEIVDRKPDMYEETIHDSLVPEMAEIIDREIIKEILNAECSTRK